MTHVRLSPNFRPSPTAQLGRLRAISRHRRRIAFLRSAAYSSFWGAPRSWRVNLPVLRLVDTR
jgi:hypothetical protein